MKKSFILYACLFLAVPVSIFAQNTLMEVNIEDQETHTMDKNFGPNRKHYVTPYMAFAIPHDLNIDDDFQHVIPIQSWRSGNLDLGLNYKYRLNQFFAIGSDLSFSFSSVQITELGSLNGIPQTEFNFNREFIGILQLGAAPYFRINLNKRRGDHLGKYIDFGVFGNWNFSENHQFNNATGVFQPTIQNLNIRDANLIQPFDWGLNLKVGFNRFLIFSEYRMSNILNTANTTDAGILLPRFRTGVRFGG